MEASWREDAAPLGEAPMVASGGAPSEDVAQSYVVGASSNAEADKTPSATHPQGRMSHDDNSSNDAHSTRTARHNSQEELNQMSNEILEQFIKEAIKLDSNKPQKIAAFMTNDVLHRMHCMVWKLPHNALNGWSKQRILAKVVALGTGGRCPAWADAERPGQYMADCVRRYTAQRARLVRAEKDAARRAPGKLQAKMKERYALEQELFHCRFGCTPAQLPVRVTPPGMLRRNIEWETCHFAEANLKMKAENILFKQLESETVLLAEADACDARRDLKVAMAQVSKLEATADSKVRVAEAAVEAKVKKMVKSEHADLVSKVLEQKQQLCILGSKITTAYSEAARFKQQADQAVDHIFNLRQHANEAREKRMAEERKEAQRRKEDAAARKKELKQKAEELNAKQADIYRLGGQLAKATQAAAAVSTKMGQMEKKALKVNQRLKEDVSSRVEEVKNLRRLKSAALKRKREVESSADARVLTSKKRLARAQAAEEKLDEANRVIEELKEEIDQLKAAKEDQAGEHAAKRARRDERGRFEAEDWRMRPIQWAQLGRRTPPSAVSANIRDALEVYAPHVRVADASERQVQLMRGELTIAGECLANFRVALSLRILSFGLDESTKFGLGVLSSNTQIEPHDAPGTSVDVVQRGATLTAGGTSEAIAKSVDVKIFSHGRRLLYGWSEVHEQKFGEGNWAADGGPSPECLGMHRLSENTVVMMDNCNGAEKCKRILIDVAEAAGKERIGKESWDRMSQEMQQKKCRAHLGRCHQHLRNTIANAMQLKATDLLKGDLADDLAEFSSFDRMSADSNDLIRSTYKELHPGGAYAKGKGRESAAWRKVRHPSAAFMPFERAEGGRQDLSFDGAAPIYFNKLIVLDFLKELVSVPDANNQLEKFNWRMLSCNEMTAQLRVNTLWKYIFSTPTRWLAGKGSKKLKNWSLESANKVLDLVEKMLISVSADGRCLFDPNFDPFASIAEEQPAFAEWRRKYFERKVKAADGTPHEIHKLALAEARNPTLGGNKQSTEKTIQLAEAMAHAGLQAMHDPRRAIRDLLLSQDGQFAVGKDPTRHRATIGCHITNDRVESNFGCVDLLMRMFRYSTIENISGIAQQMRNHDFDRPPKICSDRRNRTSEAPPREHVGGFFYNGINTRLQESLVEYSRRSAASARADGRKALEEQEKEKMARREERVMKLLNAAVDHYAYAKELFAAWQGEGRVSSAHQLQSLLRGKSEAQQLELLRKQIEMRVLGLGWTQYSTRWSSSADSRIGSVTHMEELVKEIIVEEISLERLNKLPTQPAPPQFSAKDLGRLGTLDADAASMQSRALFSVQELEKKAEAHMQRRIEAGIADNVENMQPTHPPPFDQSLVGKRIEVLWKYFEKGVDGNDKPHLIWCTGRIVRVADGLADKRSKRARTLLPAGAVLWAWDADLEFDEVAGEQWLILLPQKFNPSTQKQVYSWRLDPRELGALQGNMPDQRRKDLRRAATDE